jgi:hypothetical protein
VVQLENRLKRGHESDQHLVLKQATAATLRGLGYDVRIEEDTMDGHRIDVYGINGEKQVVVECETLGKDTQARLSASFSKALLKFGPFEGVLCLPKFVDVKEVWMVDGTGKLIKFAPQVS